ncbi:type IX secretion system membrane protein PorP/SprF [Flavobacterium cucumis]|jgi:type IX secretion system PorP/SprF family membrane protein|uniref:Type IX secretion system membrane protein, PorP/SprF family n=1 Tax=Flavobacterium cucumis TaxID=416016 RepID=A0A1M7ZT63_9FLAO|nr:type IX secretion system membrane protein PorP/SprF [Flavobacterium cucumis]SHO72066.1 type IX secretion system membrane protein, PorP/SprF family [Flavobacterium cucumis]
MNLKKSYYILVLLLAQFTYSQEGIAVYSDYLSDNYYLIHPSMAGAANCGKIRITGRQQWFGQDDAPALQTVSFNTSLGQDATSGIGIILFNDKNGYHSQKGAKLTYAHHLRFSRTTVDLNQLSFGLSTAFVQSTLDETQFIGQPFDPFVFGGIYQKDAYFNIDLGVSYHYLDFFTHFTIKNFLANRREIYTEGFESDNLSKYLWSAGAVLGNENNLLFEPSFMFQYTSETKEKALDLNLKVYKELDFGRLWGGLSYRRSFDGAQFNNDGSIEDQKLQWITPIIGLNYDQFMFSYTYSHIMGDVKFDNGGFHQITLGINVFCRDKKWDCNCPAVN